MCVPLCFMHTNRSMRTTYGVSSLCLPCGSQVLNSGCLPWWQAPFPTEPSHWHQTYYFLKSHIHKYALAYCHLHIDGMDILAGILLSLHSCTERQSSRWNNSDSCIPNPHYHWGLETYKHKSSDAHTSIHAHTFHPHWPTQMHTF